MKINDEMYELTVETFRFFSSTAHEIKLLMQLFESGQLDFMPILASNFLKQLRAAAFFFQEELAMEAEISSLCLPLPMLKIDSVAKEGEEEYLALANLTVEPHPSVEYICKYTETPFLWVRVSFITWLRVHRRLASSLGRRSP